MAHAALKFIFNKGPDHFSYISVGLFGDPVTM